MAVAGAVLRRVDAARIDGMPGAVAKYAEEARLKTLVAGGAVAVLLDREQDGVVVAVDADFVDGLVVARLLALAPQAIARAREVAGVAGLDGFLEGLAVHVSDHQEASALIVLRDDRDDAAGLFEVDLRGGLLRGRLLRCWLGFHLRAPALGRRQTPFGEHESID